jgi:outer membrane protein TolC
VFRVVKSYYEALLAQEMVRVAEEGLKSAAADHDKADARFKSGLAVESDLLSVQVHRAAQQEELLKARNQSKLALSTLNLEIGMPLSESFDLVKPDDSRPLEGRDLASLQAMALQQRPDLKQAELAAQSLQLATQAAQAEFLPSISAFGTVEADSHNFAANGGTNWMLGINVHFNIFNGRADQARVAESQFRQRREDALRQQMTRAVQLQVQRAFLELQTASQRIEVSEYAVRHAEESLRIIRNRYEAGLTTVTDLLRAEVAVTSARANFLRALFDRYISDANLELQVGRLSPQSVILRK